MIKGEENKEKDYSDIFFCADFICFMGMIFK